MKHVKKWHKVCDSVYVDKTRLKTLVIYTQ